MNHVTPVVNVRTIFGHSRTSGEFWTEICLTSGTSDGFGQIFFPETGSTSDDIFCELSHGMWSITILIISRHDHSLNRCMFTTELAFILYDIVAWSITTPSPIFSQSIRGFIPIPQAFFLSAGPQLPLIFDLCCVRGSLWTYER